MGFISSNRLIFLGAGFGFSWTWLLLSSGIPESNLIFLGFFFLTTTVLSFFFSNCCSYEVSCIFVSSIKALLALAELISFSTVLTSSPFPESCTIFALEDLNPPSGITNTFPPFCILFPNIFCNPDIFVEKSNFFGAAFDFTLNLSLLISFSFFCSSNIASNLEAILFPLGFFGCSTKDNLFTGSGGFSSFLIFFSFSIFISPPIFDAILATVFLFIFGFMSSSFLSVSNISNKVVFFFSVFFGSALSNKEICFFWEFSWLGFGSSWNIFFCCTWTCGWGLAFGGFWDWGCSCWICGWGLISGWTIFCGCWFESSSSKRKFGTFFLFSFGGALLTLEVFEVSIPSNNVDGAFTGLFSLWFVFWVDDSFTSILSSSSNKEIFFLTSFFGGCWNKFDGSPIGLGIIILGSFLTTFSTFCSFWTLLFKLFSFVSFTTFFFIKLKSSSSSSSKKVFFFADGFTLWVKLELSKILLLLLFPFWAALTLLVLSLLSMLNKSLTLDLFKVLGWNEAVSWLSLSCKFWLFSSIFSAFDVVFLENISSSSSSSSPNIELNLFLAVSNFWFFSISFWDKNEFAGFGWLTTLLLLILLFKFIFNIIPVFISFKFTPAFCSGFTITFWFSLFWAGLNEFLGLNPPLINNSKFFLLSSKLLAGFNWILFSSSFWTFITFLGCSWGCSCGWSWGWIWGWTWACIICPPCFCCIANINGFGTITILWLRGSFSFCWGTWICSCCGCICCWLIIGLIFWASISGIATLLNCKLGFKFCWFIWMLFILFILLFNIKLFCGLTGIIEFPRNPGLFFAPPGLPKRPLSS